MTMRCMRVISVAMLFCLIGLMSCSDEPKDTDDLKCHQEIQVVSECGVDQGFNTPENSPEYVIINSVRDMEALPEGALSESCESVYYNVDFAKKTLIVVTSVIYCGQRLNDDDWNWARAAIEFKRGYILNVQYYDCSVLPNSIYTQKCLIQFGFTTDKIPSDTKLTITESMVTAK